MVEIVQGTPEWHELRRGKVTASRIADIMAKTKSGYSASRNNYMAELIIETLTGTIQESYSSPAMLWGTEHEAQARKGYVFYTGNAVEEVAFVIHPDIAMAGASPDGLVGSNGLIEIKCPNSTTHLETILSGDIAKKYVLQMQWQMACTGRQWCDFVSFDPRWPEGMSLFVKRVSRDDDLIAEITTEVDAFLAEMNAKCKALQDRFLYEEAA